MRCDLESFGIDNVRVDWGAHPDTCALYGGHCEVDCTGATASFCSGHGQCFPSYISGTSGSGSGASLPAHVEVADGRRWVLMWAYAHEGGTNPPLDGTALPTSPTAGFSHMLVEELGAALGVSLTESDIVSVRFYGHTSAHNRVIHFRTEHEVARKMATLSGEHNNSVDVWTDSTTLMEGHTRVSQGMQSHSRVH